MVVLFIKLIKKLIKLVSDKLKQIQKVSHFKHNKKFKTKTKSYNKN